MKKKTDTNKNKNKDKEYLQFHTAIDDPLVYEVLIYRKQT